jgi:hypothetical protein
MINNNVIDNEISAKSVAQEEIKMGLDGEGASHLMMMLSTYLYEDNIGTPIQELLSNGLDSTIEAKKDNPVVASLLKNSGGQWEFSATDFGKGLDDEEFRSIISQYGKSTKRDSNESLGFFGIGSKSPFAYCDAYSMLCRKDGIERLYVLRKDVTGFAIDKIYEQPSEEPNGVKVIIPVKERDYDDFKAKILEKTAYFEQVYFNIEYKASSWETHRQGEILTELNDFTIVDTPYFKYSTLDKSGRTKILLGRINYALNMNSLGISNSHYNVPIALKFSLDEGLFPLPNRESVKLDSKSIKLILEKYRNALEWLISRFNENTKELESLEDFYDYYDNLNNRTVNISPDDTKPILIDLNSVTETYKLVCNKLEEIENKNNSGFSITRLEVVKPVLKSAPLISTLTPKHSSTPILFRDIKNLFHNYDVIAEIKDNRYSKKHFSLKKESVCGRMLTTLSQKAIISNEDIPAKGKHRDYVKETYGDLFVLKPSGYEMTYGDPEKKNYGNDNSTYIGLLHLCDFLEDLHEQIITEWKTVQEDFLTKCIKIEDTVPSQEWLDTQKKKIERVKKEKVERGENYRIKLQEEINLKLSKNLGKYSQDWSCKFEDCVIKIEQISTRPYLIVYGLQEDRRILDNLYQFTRYEHLLKSNKQGKDHKYKGGIRPAILGQRDIEKIKGLKIHNLKSIQEFMSEHGKLLGNYVAARKIYDFLKDKRYYTIIDNNLKFIKHNISVDLSNKVEELKAFKDKYPEIRYFENGLAKTIIDTVEENNWENLEIKALLKEVESKMEKLDFLNYLLGNGYRSYLQDDQVPFIHEVLRARKFRMDSKHYPKIQNLVEEELEEILEDVDALQDLTI